jgi:hypothetical protein
MKNIYTLFTLQNRPTNPRAGNKYSAKGMSHISRLHETGKLKDVLNSPFSLTSKWLHATFSWI